LARVLESRGFQIVSAPSTDFDLAWIRGGAGALHHVKALRARGFRGPVILPTAAGELLTSLRRVTPVRLRASLLEIEGAIHSALPLRLRTPRPVEDRYGFGFDTSALAVLLTSTECLIAEPILAGRGDLVPRQNLEAMAFPRRSAVAKAAPRQTSFDTHMTAVRRKLALLGVEIVTVRGRGYFARLFRH
jgi:hypothetical protein